MITVSNVSLQFGGSTLFKNVDLKFTNGNCYGIIGANGAGKSTFLKILSGELEPTTGDVSVKKDARMSVLKQDHFAYEEYTVLDTIIMGNEKLYSIMKEKDELYAKEDFSEEEDSYEIITSPADFTAVREALEKEKISFASAEVTMIPQNYVELTSEEDIKKMNRILDLLDEDDDVQDVFHNWDE